MNIKCTLPKNVNMCLFCNKEKMECSNENTCTFQEKNGEPQNPKYVREERWYEKYYKDTKPKKN